ncbi:MAG: penicillin acylase family protein [Bacteriovoracaceae bacterium]
MHFLIIFLWISLAFGESSSKCDANFDVLNIPHQIVTDENEFYYCFGYHHGRDRAWQMDYFRRSAEGRNAEVLGFDHLKSDLMMRLLNLPELAHRIWNDLPEEKKNIFRMYTAGVNAGFELGKNSREFQDQNYIPEEWKPVDSLLVLLIQSFDQCRRTFLKDYDEERAKEDHGLKAEELFNVDGMPWENTILKNGEYKKKIVTTQSNRDQVIKLKLWSDFPTIFGEESGSNNWVISKEKSKTGHAILANDPHLELKTPMFWYWIHLKSPEGEVIGSTLPGVPIIVAGTNGKVAWGLTNSYFNTSDVVFLDDKDKENFQKIRPLVWIKFGFIKLPFFFKKFEKTKWGHPIVPLELKTEQKMILKWTGFSLKGEDISSMLNIFKAKNVKEMDDHLKNVGVPSWNFVFADTLGGIGMRVVGKLYKQTKKDSFGIETQNKEELLDEKFLSPDEVPQLLNPKRQYIYTANNRHWPNDSEFYGGRGYALSFRGYRIDDLLEGKHDIESFKAIQCDRQAVDAKFFRERIVKYIDFPALNTWEFDTNDGSGVVPIFRRMMDLMMEKWKVTEFGLYRMLENLDKNQQLELNKIYHQSLKDIKSRTWGEVHRVNFPHLSKNTKWSFSPDIPGIGDNATVDPGTSKWNPDRQVYEQTAGASMRMIIELKSRPEVFLALPGLNRNYTEKSQQNPWDDWKNCRYSKVNY